MASNYNEDHVVTLGQMKKSFQELRASDPAGKSAYKYAKEGGYTGTEEQFGVALANLLNNAN